MFAPGINEFLGFSARTLMVAIPCQSERSFGVTVTGVNVSACAGRAARAQPAGQQKC